MSLVHCVKTRYFTFPCGRMSEDPLKSQETTFSFSQCFFPKRDGTDGRGVGIEGRKLTSTLKTSNFGRTLVSGVRIPTFQL